MTEPTNTVYAKDDGALTLYADHVEWEWDNDGETGTEVFSLDGAARELEMSGREDLAELVREALS